MKVKNNVVRGANNFSTLKFATEIEHSNIKKQCVAPSSKMDDTGYQYDSDREKPPKDPGHHGQMNVGRTHHCYSFIYSQIAQVDSENKPTEELLFFNWTHNVECSVPNKQLSECIS